jgi:hypothetical protein
VFRANGTYDLPFGKNKRFLNKGRVVDAIFGSWTVGTITAIQTGNPATMSGFGYATVTSADSGVVFNGITANDFQSGIKIQHTGLPYVQTFDPKFVGANGMANPQYLTPQTTPGAFGYRPVLYAPLWWNSDASVTKSIPVHENWRMTLQGTAANVFNHPTIGIGSVAINSTSFGRATPGGTRRIELRANIEF